MVVLRQSVLLAACVSSASLWASVSADGQRGVSNHELFLASQQDNVLSSAHALYEESSHSFAHRVLNTDNACGITVDGDIKDWTAADFFKDMNEAGKPDKIVGAKAYTRMDCAKRTLCIFVQAVNGFALSTSDAWFKDYTAGQSTLVPTAAGIKFGYSNGNAISWEGCFVLPTNAKGTDIEIHANFGSTTSSAGRTASTGKNQPTKTVLDYGKCYQGTAPPSTNCVQAARLDGTNAPRGGGSGMFTSSPIQIIAQKDTTVDFAVKQTWKASGSVSALGVLYASNPNATLTCPVTTACTEKTATYTARCVNGLAEIAVFVTDTTFTGLPSIVADLPDACALPGSSTSNTGMYAFTVPCKFNPAYCVENIVCEDKCPTDPTKTNPDVCGCGVPDTDSDGDLTPNCNDKCPNDKGKVDPGQCGCSMSEIDTDLDGTADCIDKCPTDPTKTLVGQCGCGVPDVDTDKDTVMDCRDQCPTDPAKTVPGVCGCGNPETDTDKDGRPDCADCCPTDPLKTNPGKCGCGKPDTDTDGDGTPDCNDSCPTDKDKLVPGTCGCGKPDIDTDGDGTPDCTDSCPTDKTKTVPGTCGCGVPDVDTDKDGKLDCEDFCKDDPKKTDPLKCGCGQPETDSDGDGTPDCIDNQCPLDPNKLEPGVCGCGTPDTDSDGDGTPDCHDKCKDDKDKTDPGKCGCGYPDVDTDKDGTLDCEDECEEDPAKTKAGICGCGESDVDTDGDGTVDCEDECQDDPSKTTPGTCGCGEEDKDTDGDGTLDCKDGCAEDPQKTEPGKCGCGEEDKDTDGDGVLDCEDSCPEDPKKTDVGECGCGVEDKDTDGDGVLDCEDACPEDPTKTVPGGCGCGKPDTDSNNNGIPDCNEPDDRDEDLPPKNTTNCTNGCGGFGDPHLKTWTGEVYDFHGECDLVLVSTVFADGQRMDLHIRTEMREDWSFISATAVRIGEDVLEIGSKGMYWLNDVAGAILPATLGGYSVTLSHYGNRRHKFEVDLGYLGKIEVKVFSDFLAVMVEKPHADGFANSVGLMGSFTDGSLIGRNGLLYTEDHNAFGMQWQVRDTEPQLFHEAVGPQWPTVCNMPVVRATASRRLSESSVTYEQAAAACKNWSEEARESCIYDIMATGDLSMADAGY